VNDRRTIVDYSYAGPALPPCSADDAGAGMHGRHCQLLLGVAPAKCSVSRCTLSATLHSTNTNSGHRLAPKDMAGSTMVVVTVCVWPSAHCCSAPRTRVLLVGSRWGSSAGAQLSRRGLSLAGPVRHSGSASGSPSDPSPPTTHYRMWRPHIIQQTDKHHFLRRVTEFGGESCQEK
jgi:hypothetical protein